MPKKQPTTPKTKTPPTPENTAGPAPAAGEPQPLDGALAEAAFKRLRPTLEALPEASLKSIRVDLEQAALVALSFAQRELSPARRARYAALPAGLFDQAQLDGLQPAAWATWYANRQLGLASASTSEVKLPVALVAEASGVEARMQSCLEYHLGDDPVIGPVLALLRPGTGHRDLASDLQGYAEIYRSHREAIQGDRKNYRPSDLADAERLSTRMMSLLAASLTPESRLWSDLRLRAFNHLLATYNEVSETGWWLHRHEPTRDQDYPGFFAAIRAAFPLATPRPAAPSPSPEKPGT